MDLFVDLFAEVALDITTDLFARVGLDMLVDANVLFGAFVGKGEAVV